MILLKYKQNQERSEVKMDAYAKLAKYSTFKLSDVNKMTGNISTSTSLLTRLINKGYVYRIRKDLYTCKDLVTGQPVANKYQIASAINDGAYVSHHSAFEFYGMANQVYNVMYVSSEMRFNPFEFIGITYKQVSSTFRDGVVQVRNIEKVFVTDIERSLIDSVFSMSKIAGIEEVIKIIEVIDDLDELKVLKYLEKYNNKFLYQKIGYLLESFYLGEGLTEDFFELCQKNSGSSVRYLSQVHEGNFVKKWNLVVPVEFLVDKESEIGLNEYI